MYISFNCHLLKFDSCCGCALSARGHQKPVIQTLSHCGSEKLFLKYFSFPNTSVSIDPHVINALMK